MKKIKIFLMTFAALALTGFSFIYPSKASAWVFDRTLAEGEYLIDHANAAMIVNDVDPNVLFNLMTDHTKDKLFYFGVGDARLVSGDGGKGSVFVEDTFLGPVTIYVLKKDAPKEYVIYGTSATHRYIATYKFNQRPDNSVEYRSYNTLVASVPGLSAEFFKQYLDSGDQNILNYLGKTGEIVQDVPPLSDENASSDWDLVLQ